MAHRWYVLHVHSGFEKKVAQTVRETALKKGLEEYFSEILVPTEEVVEVRRGAKVNAAGKYGETPLMLAADRNEPELSKALLDQGAKVNATAAQGVTPLIIAAGAGSDRVVALLLQKGANAKVKMERNFTPLKAARDWYDASLKEYNCGTEAGCDKPGKLARYNKMVQALKHAGAKQ